MIAEPLSVPGTDNGSAITNYAYSVDGGAFTALASPDSQSPITIPNLTNGQEHSIVFRAINAIGEGANSNAISITPQPDSDGDGVLDTVDAFPNDPTENRDSDRDGVGDNADAFPNDPTRSALPATPVPAKPVPLMPALVMLLLAGLLALLGIRRLKL